MTMSCGNPRVAIYMSCFFQYNVDAEKVANLLQIPLYFVFLSVQR